MTESMSLQINGLHNPPVPSARSCHPQTIQNHILAQCNGANHVKSHPCAETGGRGIRPFLPCPEMGVGLGSEKKRVFAAALDARKATSKQTSENRARQIDVRRI